MALEQRPVVEQQYTFVALVETLDQVVRVLRQLHDLGLTADQLSVLAKDQAAVQEVVREGGARAEEAFVDDVAEQLEPKGRAPMSGAVLGGAVGFLVGLTALAVPGLGAFLLASGPVAIAFNSLTISAAGMGMGALLGAILDERVTEEHRTLYHQRLEQGWWMVIVHADDTNVEQVAASLNASRVAHLDMF